MYKINKKGFTLVELLAVIVVLAIIMVIAAPAVIKAMNDAKKGTFKVYAQKVLNQAQARYQNDVLLGVKDSDANPERKKVNISGAGSPTGYCYTLTQLGITTKGNYNAIVFVTFDSNMVPTYYITITDNSFSISNATYEKLDDSGNIIAPLSSDPTCPDSWTKPS